MSNIPKLNRTMLANLMKTFQGILAKDKVQAIADPYMEGLNLYKRNQLPDLGEVRLSPYYRANNSFADYSPLTTTSQGSIVIDPLVAKGGGAPEIIRQRALSPNLDSIEQLYQNQSPVKVIQHETNHHQQTLTGLDRLLDRDSQELLANQHADIATARIRGYSKKDILDGYIQQYGEVSPRIPHVKSSLEALRAAILLPALAGQKEQP